jgi:hypothetical protein
MLHPTIPPAPRRHARPPAPAPRVVDRRPPVPAITAAQVAKSCAVIGEANLRLDAALAEPTLARFDPEEYSHVQA